MSAFKLPGTRCEDIAPAVSAVDASVHSMHGQIPTRSVSAFLACKTCWSYIQMSLFWTVYFLQYYVPFNSVKLFIPG